MMRGREERRSTSDRDKSDGSRLAGAAVRIVIDVVIALACTTVAALLFGTPPGALASGGMLATLALTAGIVLVSLFAAGLYAPRRYEPAESALRLAAALSFSAACLSVIAALHGRYVLAAPASLVASLCAFPAMLFSRFPISRPRRRANAGASRTIIVGARDAARAVIRLLQHRDDLLLDVVGCVDDEESVRSVEGVPLLGRLRDLPALVLKNNVETVVVAATSAQPRLIKQVMAECAAACDGRPPIIKVLPHLDHLLTGQVKYSPVRDVRLDDLLLRDAVQVDLAQIAPHLRDRVVLVTGAGGSIGSELCRQISRFSPKLLVMVGHGENSLFAIDHELRAELGATNTRIVLADVADGFRVRSVFTQYRPHIVFHAAAHKHVPILETNVCEAVRNNIFGTHAVALAAAAAGVAKFVMISTDKAVNPTSIMGATKRVAELICQSFERRTGTEFVSVRFGNVLGSRGSVIDVFTRQIEAGGPLTVTHPDMVRYFMTIPEAVALVLEATAIGRDGQVFVLDMGKPVSVVELAENLVRLCGLRPYEDIDIVFTGIRPGEKLREEIFTPHELENPTGGSVDNPTGHERLFVAQQERIVYELLVELLSGLEVAVRTQDVESVLTTLRTLVPEFRPGPHLRESVASEAQEPASADPNHVEAHPAIIIEETTIDASDQATV